ncbi:Protein of unknown function [Wenxinia saemankumensis]|uniref:DUF3072 domain-containing protein n=2 Tax=Wenxinia saemankumensis TaxID=1447782 RepID=A0A1M6CTT5_9RHOB|nr:Protein of unknown function [Wenxinia saemankumensis]
MTPGRHGGGRDRKATTMSTMPMGQSAPMTTAQKSELQQLCERTGEQVERELTHDQASARIEVLRSLRTLPCR